MKDFKPSISWSWSYIRFQDGVLLYTYYQQLTSIHRVSSVMDLFVVPTQRFRDAMRPRAPVNVVFTFWLVQTLDHLLTRSGVWHLEFSAENSRSQSDIENKNMHVTISANLSQEFRFKFYEIFTHFVWFPTEYDTAPIELKLYRLSWQCFS